MNWNIPFWIIDGNNSILDNSNYQDNILANDNAVTDINILTIQSNNGIFDVDDYIHPGELHVGNRVCVIDYPRVLLLTYSLPKSYH